jgi:diguanylate cyclase (GGDEF)-like protein
MYNPELDEACDGAAWQPRKDRDVLADERDEAADARDIAAADRDAAANAREHRSKFREVGVLPVDTEELLDRAQIMKDRMWAARDREAAANDRREAWKDRVQFARDRADSLVDTLTGAHRRDSGILELEREVARARRRHSPFVLAFADADDLKATNDLHGHAEGDRLLRKIAETLRNNVRSYDLVVRFGGDEFVIGFSDLTLQEVTARLDTVRSYLLSTERAAVTIGVAELSAGQSLATLIALADHAMYRQRRAKQTKGV